MELCLKGSVAQYRARRRNPPARTWVNVIAGEKEREKGEGLFVSGLSVNVMQSAKLQFGNGRAVMALVEGQVRHA